MNRMKRRIRRKKRRVGFLTVSLVILFFLIFVAANKDIAGSDRNVSFSPVRGMEHSGFSVSDLLNSDISFLPFHRTGHQTASEENGWNLILVNRNNYIPEDYEVELTELANGQEVDSRIYPKLQEMFNDARAEGLGLFVVAGYRTGERQQQLLDEKTEEYRSQGKSRAKAKKLAEEWVAIPGTSEHQLGIAVDINADTTISASDEVYAWLAENAWKYGFIQRYPEEKKDITGIIHEPWHYRYVGEEASEEIWSRGICLEEYINGL